MFKRIIVPRWLILIVDLFLHLFALGFAYLVRFDLKADKSIIRQEWEILSKSILLFILVKLIVFYFFSFHKSLIRHTSLSDIKRFLFATILCSFSFLVLGLIRFYFFDHYFLFPTSVLISEFFISFFLVISFRFAVKLVHLEQNKVKHENEENILIYGAGISGIAAKRTLERDTKTKLKIINFLDDNPSLSNKRIEGIAIKNTNKIEEIHQKNNISKLIVAIQKPRKNLLKKVSDFCIENNIEIFQVPKPESWIDGNFSSKQISKIKIEDLLGRNPIVLNTDKISNELNNKIVLVTGAAGSIGSGLVKEIANFKPKLLILFDQAESPLFELEQELYTNYPEINFEIIIGDIRVKERIEKVFSHFKPNFVFHAAAYKHVPLMENNPSEAINTNIKGSVNLVDLAVKYKIIKFVLISTDKAVNPTNIMGASKRIAEIYAQEKNSSITRFITTRFGNVLGSNGSVIPLFKKQIEAGGPITVTDENITRFFMTIPEACQLVLEAASMGEGGEIFVFDMGESVKIIDLAKKMIKLSGLELNKDIEIKITGLRPGEKLYEELLADEETTLETHHPQILKAKEREKDQKFSEEILNLISPFEIQDNMQLVAQMKKIVPEFKSNNSIFTQLD